MKKTALISVVLIFFSVLLISNSSVSNSNATTTAPTLLVGKEYQMWVPGGSFQMTIESQEGAWVTGLTSGFTDREITLTINLNKMVGFRMGQY